MAEDKFEQAVIEKLKSALMLDLRTDFSLPCKLMFIRCKKALTNYFYFYFKRR